MKKYHFTAIFEPQEEGGFTVTVPALPGCISEGDTYEQARTNIIEAIESYVGSLIAEGDFIPEYHKTQSEVVVPIEILIDPNNPHSKASLPPHV